MLKLLQLTSYISHYRIPVYNTLNEYYDLTVAHYGDRLSGSNIHFKQIILSHKRCGSFIYFKENIFKLCQQYNAVIVLSDLHIIPYVTLGLFLKRKFSLIFHGIGVSASYQNKYGINKYYDFIRFALMKRAESNVFYSEHPIQRYLNSGISRKSLFVAHNTIFIKEKIDISQNKNIFLFIGTLYKEKRIYDLLDAYYIAYNKEKTLKSLVIIGDGIEKDNIEKWIIKSRLSHKIFIKNAIYDFALLKIFYSDAIACISPGQAGLSVLSCFACGVPFVTMSDAFTGGEIF